MVDKQIDTMLSMRLHSLQASKKELEIDISDQAIIGACERGNKEIIEYIHKNKISIPDDSIDYASEFGHLKLANYLHSIRVEKL